MVKDKIFETQENIVAITNDKIPDFLEHLHNISNQHCFYKKIKTNLDSKTAVLHSDFSENYATKCYTEVQALHFGGSRALLTIHTNAYYILDPVSKKIDLGKFCTISEDFRHTAPAIFANLKPLLQSFQDLGIKTLYIFTDGPTGQYKNKTNFFLLCNFAKEYGFEKVIWNYFESGDGKGPIDGFGATLKSKADSKVGQGFDITNAESFINAVKDVNINLLEIKADEINTVEKIVSNGGKLKAATGTLKIHLIIWKSKNEDVLYLRKRSCIHCEDFTPCSKCDLETPVYHPTSSAKEKINRQKPGSKSGKGTVSLWQNKNLDVPLRKM